MAPLSEQREQGCNVSLTTGGKLLPQNSTNTPVQRRAAVKAKQFVQHEWAPWRLS